MLVMAKKPLPKNQPEREDKGSRISQSDVPAYSFSRALEIPKAIADNYGYKPTTPLKVAGALNMSPTSSGFRMLCGAAIAYGITEGGYNAPSISITALGMKVLKPKAEGEDIAGKREALLKPRVVSEFLKKYNSASLPRQDIALNVLEDFGVPKDRSENVYKLILDEAKAVGFISDIKGKAYVDLEGTEVASAEVETGQQIPAVEDENLVPPVIPAASLSSPKNSDLSGRKRKVFITHGKNKAFLEPLKQLLLFGELEPIVSVERQSVSQPVPDKVIADMRLSGGAIIHVDAEQKMLDSEGQEHVVLNQNVLIEIGAAMALYGRRFILLVKDTVKLPSNLLGLYEVRYSNDALDGDTTIKLLKSIKELKSQPLPEERLLNQ